MAQTAGWLDATVDIAREAGAAIMRHYGSAEKMDKGGLDLVTAADFESEQLILDQLSTHFPDHGFVAEEKGNSTEEREWVWFIDPLDGTGNFSRCDPHFAVSLGLVYRGRPFLGVVYNPARDQLFSAAPELPGGEPRFNGDLITSLPFSPSLKTASLATDWPWSLERRTYTAGFLRDTAPCVRQVKIRGCAALDLCDVATGVLDGYFHPGLAPWDIAAAAVICAAQGILLLGESGDWRFSDRQNQVVTACSPALVQPLQQLVGKVFEPSL